MPQLARHERPESGANVKILYVEDNPTACDYVEKGLAERGFEVDVARDGREGLQQALTGSYDLLILDVMLPGIDGVEILRRILSREMRTPVLFLSARVGASDRIKGLNLGADDYLVKPYAFGELLARIRAVARRAVEDPADGRLQVSDLEIDLNRHVVTRGGRSLTLTPKEFALLEYLARNAGHVLSRAMIVEKVWGFGFESYSNFIDVHVNHLRKKVERPGAPKLIHTVKGAGYILEDRSTGPPAGLEGSPG
jgi:two-component system copper resistance phosphate regulon response regulator CusR